MKWYKSFIHKVFQSGKPNLKNHSSQNCETLDFTGLKRFLNPRCRDGFLTSSLLQRGD